MAVERTDRELLEASVADPEAFAAFYRRHAPRVLAYFRRRTGGVDVAFDLTAETFAAALQAVGRYRPRPEPDAAVAWLFAIARHKLSEAARRGQVEDRTRRALAMQPVVLTDEGLERLDAEADDALRALDDLPADQAAAIRARLLDERGYGEIAAALDCSPSVVRQRVSRGLAALRTALEEGPDGS